MSRIFYTFFFLFCILGLSCFSQHVNYDSILTRFSSAAEKYEYLHEALKKDTRLGASVALVLSKKQLEYAMELADTNKIASSYNQIGSQYLDLADYGTAMNYYLKSAKFYGYIKDSVGISMTYQNMGLIYSSKGDVATAKRMIAQALAIEKKHSKDIEKLCTTMGNLGDAYRSLNMIDSAFYYYRLVIRHTKDSSGLAIVYNNIGLYYLESNKLDSAMVFLKLSNYIDRRLGNKFNHAISIGNIADCYYRRGDVKKAIEEYHFALGLSRQLNNPELIMTNCGALADIFAGMKRYDSAHRYLEEYADINDSLHSTNDEMKMADLRSGFDRENREKELKIQQLELEQKEKKHGDVVNSFIVASLFLIIIIGFAVFRYKAKQRSYDELKQLNDEVTTQKNLVEEKQKEIVDSITYARRIQRPLLAKEEDIRQQFGDCFIVFKPKDIVSGDFYWTTISSEIGVESSVFGVKSSENREEDFQLEAYDSKHINKNTNKSPSVTPNTGLPAKNFYLAVCDSTGHGVPGAFMSLLNIGFLSEAIKEKHIDHPDGIFNYVRGRLVESIGDDNQKDGFDGTILRWKKNSMQLEYAAAHNAPLLIRDNAIIEMAADKMPVGKGERVQPFSLYKIDVKKDDLIYLFTDGYADQFGGPKGKKFKYKKLHELLLSIHKKPMKEQKTAIEAAFEEWKGDLEQVDDVTIIGLKI